MQHTYIHGIIIFWHVIIVKQNISKTKQAIIIEKIAFCIQTYSIIHIFKEQ